MEGSSDQGREVRNSIPVKTNAGSVVVFNILKDIFPDRSDDALELLANDVDSAVNKLRAKYDIFLQARKDLLRRLSNGSRDELRHTIGSKHRVPHSSDIHEYAAFAISKFLRDQLSEEDIDVRTTAVVTPRLNMEFGPKAYHFITVIGFNEDNVVGGKNLIPKDNRMLFIDSCSPYAHLANQLIIDKVSNLFVYDLMLPNKQMKKNDPGYNHFAAEAVTFAAKKNRLPLDKHAQFLYDSLYAAERLKEFYYSTDLLADGLASVLRNKGEISKETRAKLMKVLPESFFVEGIEEIIKAGGKTAEQIKRKMRLLADGAAQVDESLQDSAQEGSHEGAADQDDLEE